MRQAARVRVVLLCHAVTEGVRRVSFGDDEPPTEAGLASLAHVTLPRIDRASRGPSESCRITAERLGLTAEIDARLTGCDYGRWHGQTLDEVSSAEPDALTQWLTDPDAAPHGGETLAELQERVGRWLDEQPGTRPDARPGTYGGDRAVLAVADSAVVRAAVAYAIEAGPRALWRIEVPPLCRVVLAGQPGRWSLRELAHCDR